jgi:hypothetical protein
MHLNKLNDEFAVMTGCIVDEKADPSKLPQEFLKKIHETSLRLPLVECEHERFDSPCAKDIRGLVLIVPQRDRLAPFSSPTS